MFLPSISASSNLFPFSGQVAIFASATFYDAVYLGSARFSLVQFEWQVLVNPLTWKSISIEMELYSIAVESTSYGVNPYGTETASLKERFVTRSCWGILTLFSSLARCKMSQITLAEAVERVS